MSEPLKKLIGFIALVAFGVLGIIYIDKQSLNQPDGVYGVCIAALWGAFFFIASIYFLFKRPKA